MSEFFKTQQLVKAVKKLLTESMRFDWEPDCAFQIAVEKVENALVAVDPTYERQFEIYAHPATHLGMAQRAEAEGRYKDAASLYRHEGRSEDAQRCEASHAECERVKR